MLPQTNEIIDIGIKEDDFNTYGRAYISMEIKEAITSFKSNLSNDPDYLDKVSNNLMDQENSRSYLLKLILNKTREHIQGKDNYGLKKVINATGVVLHTNLGRAPLSKRSLDAIQNVASGYCNLEYDLAKGERGNRDSNIEELLIKITGAESATIVNNNAAAVFICLNTFGVGKEVIVSRGEQVEIGGSFRIPDIITRSGANMIEIGSTNKTNIRDYNNAITENTSMLLKVHTSNYKITGFTQNVGIKELSKLAAEKKIIVYEDLGSGCLIETSKFGAFNEPSVQQSIIDGADIVSFSGDKLLGGPQAGIIAGKKILIDRIKKNPLSRMLRCDKLTIAALVEVLKEYNNKDFEQLDIPVIRMLTTSKEELKIKANDLKCIIDRDVSNYLETKVIDDEEEVGGGSLPGHKLDGIAIAIVLKDYDIATNDIQININQIQENLRNLKIPIIARIKEGNLMLNLRTIDKSDFEIVAFGIKEALGIE